MRRRDFIKAVTGSAIMWPLAVRAQQPTMPVVASLRTGSAASNARNVAAFHKGLNETGYVEGQNVTVDYYWLESPYDRLPALIADLVRRQVAVITTIGTPQVALAVKAGTATIPRPAWPCRQPRPPRRQCDRHLFSHNGDYGQAAAAPA
jgi:putative tryptophan/tyrosine transport system substrate-binding protein